MRPLVLIRPEPGLSASAERAEALGLAVIRWPLFRIEPVAWTMPDVEDYDAMLLTSANAVRQAGSGLSQLSALPVHAVGEATAEAARQAGLSVTDVGEAGVDALLGFVPPATRLLHLAGEDRAARSVDGEIDEVIVYRSVATAAPPPSALADCVIAVHSPRAGAELATRTKERATIRIAAISAVAADACGTGWAEIRIADAPADGPLLSLAATLCKTGAR